MIRSGPEGPIMTEVEFLRPEVEDLKAEIERLRRENLRMKLQQRELWIMLSGPNCNAAPNDLDIALEIKAIRPFSEVLAELGITRWTPE
jgi:hypothetical protein